LSISKKLQKNLSYRPADLTYAEQKSAAISEASQYTSDFEHFEEIAKNLSYRLR
jgi:hypothetical protein